MTYIEFFDRQGVRNICTSLIDPPQRVIFLGDNSKLMNRHIAYYQRVLADRGLQIQFSCRTVSKSNLQHAVQVLSQIVEEYEDCVFDITGGEEMLLLALGMVCARYPDRNIQIHKVNIHNNAIYDCDMDGITVCRQAPCLTVEENVRIYGGDVVYGAEEDSTYRWDMNQDFCQDIQRMWDICKADVRLWNVQINLFEAMESAGTAEGLTTTVGRRVLEQHLQQSWSTYKPVKGFISSLQKAGLLTFFEDADDLVTISYKNHQVKKCLNKAGLALEMKMYLTALQLREKDGTPVYNNAMNGVVIDWDGRLHDEGAEHVFDTENEIDVLLMHDIVPVFVSCKNGLVTAEELYKLSTVAQRFGGQAAKKVLIATSLDRMGPAADYLRQRAKDMDIRLEENIQFLSDEELARKVRSFWCN